MKIKSITGTVTTPIVLGSGQYGPRLTITSAGAVLIPTGGGTAITAPDTLAQAVVKNSGTIEGGAGSPAKLDFAGVTGQGGDGIQFDTSGTIKNSGTILGGAGGTHVTRGAAGGGGSGVIVAAIGNVTNSGVIVAGKGASDRSNANGGAGGIGVELAGGGTLTNHGVILGGAGGYGQHRGGTGGAGVSLGGQADLTNTGSITGGSDGSNAVYYYAAGGAGVDFTGTGTLSNKGFVQGGLHGGMGIDFSSAGSLANAGDIVGGRGYYGYNAPSGGGGAGIVLSHGGTIANTGSITGGEGGGGGRYNGSTGGTGVALNGGGQLNNSNYIAGGNGGSSYYKDGGNGGTGVSVTKSMLTNYGTITGGNGGSSDYNDGGNGGTGVSVINGKLTNYGTITGGAGGYYGRDRAPVNGGVGVYIDGGTLTAAAGVIEGGQPGNYGSQGDAVGFGTTAATLIVDPGALFTGDIAANSDDALILGGTEAGTLSGFGTSITGFTTITENSGADWTLNGMINGAGTLTVGSDGVLSLDGTVSISTILFATGGPEILTLGTPTAVASTFAGFGTGGQIDLDGIQATSLKYANSTLTLFNASHNVVDTLTFSGDYTKADFALQADGNNTDVLYAGAPAHLPDFLPRDAVGPQTTGGGPLISVSERFFSSLHELLAPNWADLHNWHSPAPP
jgi:hypothetical protein